MNLIFAIRFIYVCIHKRSQAGNYIIANEHRYVLMNAVFAEYGTAILCTLVFVHLNLESARTMFDLVR